ncbi:MAG: lasso peptide biosynthesis B2 protein [Sphingomicrobium sp.]
MRSDSGGIRRRPCRVRAGGSRAAAGFDRQRSDRDSPVRRLPRFLNLPAAERSLLLRAIPLVAIVRLCLWAFPFRTLHRRWSSALPRLARPGYQGGPSPERIVWLVEVASRCVPGAHCLTRAVAAQLLLARAGHLAEIRIGVRKQGFDLDAHAWLDYEGTPLQEDIAQLDSFVTFESAIASPDDGPR